MCGIVGYVGERQAAPLMLDGLKKLEYRGYDSAGLALQQQGINVIKTQGRVETLDKLVHGRENGGTVGIGHTRWATHGRPSDENSHPHSDCSGQFAVVHNGIIENYLELIDELKSGGHQFASETDTEAVPHLLEAMWQGDLLSTVMAAVGKLEGSYAMAVISDKQPDEVVAVRQDSPLAIGIGDDEYFVTSDIRAILEHTRDVIYLEDGQFARLTRKGVQIFNSDGQLAEVFPVHIDWDSEDIEKGGYPHFMLKEIMEQPDALRNTIAGYLAEDDNIQFPEVKLADDEIKGISKIFLVACGTAYHAGLLGKHLFETMLGIPTETDLASEFRYRNPVLQPDHLVIVISQSGETADTLAAMRESLRRGAKVLAITNVVGSTIAREAPNVIYTKAGPETAVASTKAYITQLAALSLLACYVSRIQDNKWDEFKKLLLGLRQVPHLAEQFLEKNRESIEKIANDGKHWRDAFFIGRGLDWAVAQEGSLKLKEISYVHAEAYAAGELKHGTLALVEEGVPVIGLATQQNLIDKTISNIKETKARGAYVIGISQFPGKLTDAADVIIALPKLPDPLMPILSVIPTQLLSYYAAVIRNRDVDKPRNLAKSVTVE